MTIMDNNVNYAMAVAELTCNDYIIVANGQERSFYACQIDDYTLLDENRMYMDISEWKEELLMLYPDESFVVNQISRFDIKTSNLDEIKTVVKKQYPEYMLEEHKVNIKALLKSRIAKNPFSQSVWNCKGGHCKLNYSTLDEHIKNNTQAKQAEPHEWIRYPLEQAEYYHHSRVAQIVNNPDSSPILLHSHMDEVSIKDGFHRLASKIYSGETEINITFAKNLLDEIQHMAPGLIKNKNKLNYNRA